MLLPWTKIMKTSPTQVWTSPYFFNPPLNAPYLLLILMIQCMKKIYSNDIHGFVIPWNLYIVFGYLQQKLGLFQMKLYWINDNIWYSMKKVLKHNDGQKVWLLARR